MTHTGRIASQEARDDRWNTYEVWDDDECEMMVGPFANYATARDRANTEAQARPGTVWVVLDDKGRTHYKVGMNVKSARLYEGHGKFHP